MRSTSHDGIRARPVNLSKRLIVSYGDSSWANAEGMRTQIGMICVITSTNALDGSAVASVMEWKSSRTKRVIRSTLAGEACAADLASDTAFFVACMFDEALIESFRSTKATPVTRCVVCTDCRSLFDSISKVTNTISENAP